MTDVGDSGRRAPEGGPPGGVCPGEETLAAYIEGQLDDVTRAEVADHVSRCDDCYTVVREVTLAGKEEAGGTDSGADRPPAASVLPFDAPRNSHAARTAAVPRKRPLNWLARGLPWAAVLAVSAGGLFLAREQGLFLSPGDRAMRDLVEAVGQRRFFEPRLTGGFKYGPLVQQTRGAADPDGARLRLRAAAARARELAGRTRAREARHVAAVSALFTDDVDHAVRELEALVAESPTDLSTVSDLAAAYLVRGRRDDRRDDILRALTLASEVVARRPDLAEAAYNRAIALDWLAHHDEARAAWADMARRFPEDPWSRAARRLAEPR